MLPSNIDAVSPDDILALISGSVSERKRLEYKEKLPEGSDGSKKEFLADACSFANADGGDIIYGIRDKRDSNGRPTGTPESITGLDEPNLSAACDRLERMIRDGIAPRVPSVQSRGIDVTGHGSVVLLRIARSWIKPHMVTFGGTSRFYSRNSTGKFQLDVGEIGQAFAEQRSIGERLRGWRADRITKLLSDEGPVTLNGPSKMLLHFVPATALSLIEHPRNWRVPDPIKPCVRLSSLVSGSSRYNADGFLRFGVGYGGNCLSYVQVFQSGALEYGDGYILNAGIAQGRERDIPSRAFEKKIAETYENALQILDMLGVDDPIYASCTLTAVRGSRLSRDSYMDVGEPLLFDRDVVAIPEIEIADRHEARPFRTSLLPIINSVWQANGYEQSPFANEAWDPFK